MWRLPGQEALEALRAHDVDVVTFGQYMRPSRGHIPVVEYISPEGFQHWQKGYNIDAKGYMVDVKGYCMDAKGYMVDVKGYSVDAKGYMVSTQPRRPTTLHLTVGVSCPPNNVDAKGYIVDVKGYRGGGDGLPLRRLWADGALVVSGGRAVPEGDDQQRQGGQGGHSGAPQPIAISVWTDQAPESTAKKAFDFNSTVDCRH
eukprot:8798197-Pyramimonas_sp.AAC.1